MKGCGRKIAPGSPNYSVGDVIHGGVLITSPFRKYPSSSYKECSELTALQQLQASLTFWALPMLIPISSQPRTQHSSGPGSWSFLPNTDRSDGNLSVKTPSWVGWWSDLYSSLRLSMASPASSPFYLSQAFLSTKPLVLLTSSSQLLHGRPKQHVSQSQVGFPEARVEGMESL